MAYANPSTFVAGEVLTAAQQNVLANNDRFFHGPPTVRVEAAAATTVASGSTVAIIFGTERYDTDTMWSSTAATRIDINTAGKYLIGGHVRFSESTGGSFRIVNVRLNTGADMHQELYPPPETGHLQARYTVGPFMSPTLTSTQSFTFQAVQDSGASLTIVRSTVSKTPCVWAIWMSS